MSKEEHEHNFVLKEEKVLLHNYIVEGGKMQKDLIKGRDTLKTYVCDCGKSITRDMERKLNP